MSELIRNERVKLVASALNTLATASATGGILAPSFAAFYGIGVPAFGVGGLVLGSTIWLCVAVALHSLGSAFLGQLRP